MRSRWRAVTAAVLLVAAAGWWLSRAFGDPEEITWSEAAIGDLVIGVAVEGELASRDSSLLTPPQLPNVYDFKISFMAPEGALAEPGDPVLGFDASDLQRQLLAQQNEVEQAGKNVEKLDADLQQQRMGLELQLAEAEAELRKAELKNEVPDDLRAANEARVAQLDVDLATQQVASLRDRLRSGSQAGESRRAALVAQKRRAEQRVAELEQSIASMTVTAPRGGTVIYVSNWRDEKKKVGDSAWRRERIIELPNLQAMLARGEVDEADAGRIAEGQIVSLRLDAHPDVQYDGRIESIWRSVLRSRTTRSPVKAVRLDIALDNPDTERMRPAMRFRGTIETERLTDVLTVPVHTVFPTAEGPVVFRRGALGPDAVAVELGARNATRVQVLAGLSPGDRIADRRPQS